MGIQPSEWEKMPYYEYEYHVKRFIEQATKDAERQQSNSGESSQLMNKQMSSMKSMQSGLKTPKMKF